MRRRKRSIPLLILFVLSFSTLIYLIVSFSPSHELGIMNYELGILPLFFMLFSSTIFSLIAYISNNVVRGVVYGGIVSLYLYLRLIDLTHPFFLILLLALLVTVEFVLRKR